MALNIPASTQYNSWGLYVNMIVLATKGNPLPCQQHSKYLGGEGNDPPD